jgi:hypothetical protein
MVLGERYGRRSSLQVPEGLRERSTVNLVLERGRGVSDAHPCRRRVPMQSQQRLGSREEASCTRAKWTSPS